MKMKIKKNTHIVKKTVDYDIGRFRPILHKK
jgi:hypothetical protein